MNRKQQIETSKPYYYGFTGIVTGIGNFAGNQDRGCNKLFLIEDKEGNLVNFVLTPDTYVVDGVKLKLGDQVYGFYNSNAPVILIYPPQFHARVMGKFNNSQSVKVDYFNDQGISSDGLLMIRPDVDTEILLENGQDFIGDIANRELIVLYSRSTKSIPAQTVPDKIIVMC